MNQFKLVKHALDSTIGLINKGSNPTSALEKVARELDLNPNYIQRVGEALNVALHFNHFKTAENRADDFPISDIGVVTKSIFSDKELKNDMSKKAEWTPSTAQDINYNVWLTSPTFKKNVIKIADTKDDYDSYPTSLKGTYKKASDYILRLEREIDVLETQKIAEDTYIESSFNNLVTQFKKTAAARVPFCDFETRNFSVHGKDVVPYLDLIYKAANLTEDRGEHRIRKLAGDETDYVYQVFDSLIKCAGTHAERAEELRDAKEFLGLCRAKFKTATASIYPPAQAAIVEGCNELADKLGEVMEKCASKLTGDLLTTLVSDFRNAKGKNKTPAFKNTNRDNSDRTLLLQDLIMTDEILSKQDPRKILAAYQQILRIAPQLAKEKEVVRSLLRQLTATQSLAPVEANQLVEANTNLLKQQQLWHTTEDEGSGSKKK